MTGEPEDPPDYRWTVRQYLEHAKRVAGRRDPACVRALEQFVAALEPLVESIPRPSQTTLRGETARRAYEVLGDDDARAILAATGEEPLTVLELVETCEIPRSTVYRKTDSLVDVGLLEAEVRIESRGPHAREYWRPFDAIQIRFVPALEIELLPPEPEGYPDDALDWTPAGGVTATAAVGTIGGPGVPLLEHDRGGLTEYWRDGTDPRREQETSDT